MIMCLFCTGNGSPGNSFTGVVTGEQRMKILPLFCALIIQGRTKQLQADFFTWHYSWYQVHVTVNIPYESTWLLVC
jgi:hypothetical protein